MRWHENPGRFVRVEDDGGMVLAERASPRVVRVEATDEAVTAVVTLGEVTGRALLGGLARLYGCEVVETGL